MIHITADAVSPKPIAATPQATISGINKFLIAIRSAATSPSLSIDISHLHKGREC